MVFHVFINCQLCYSNFLMNNNDYIYYILHCTTLPIKLPVMLEWCGHEWASVSMSGAGRTAGIDGRSWVRGGHWAHGGCCVVIVVSFPVVIVMLSLSCGCCRCGRCRLVGVRACGGRSGMWRA